MTHITPLSQYPPVYYKLCSKNRAIEKQGFSVSMMS